MYLLTNFLVPIFIGVETVKNIRFIISWYHFLSSFGVWHLDYPLLLSGRPILVLDKTRSVWLTTCGDACKYQRDSWLSCGRRRPALHKEALYCILWQGFFVNTAIINLCILPIFVYSPMLIVVKTSPILEISFFRTSSFVVIACAWYRQHDENIGEQNWRNIWSLSLQ